MGSMHCDIMSKCTEPMEMLRVNPKAVCLSLLANLERHKRLNPQEQSAVLLALQKTGISVDRVLANFSREAIEAVQKSI